MIFHYGDKLTVTISPEVELFFQNLVSTYNYKIETGGILIGKMNDSSHLIITDITGPQEKDRRSTLRFSRSEVGHQQLMDKIWEQSEFQKMYLGEWHTHHEAYPYPSYIDSSGWLKISKKKQNSPWTLFFILGQKAIRIWTVDQGTIKELFQDAQ